MFESYIVTAMQRGAVDDHLMGVLANNIWLEL